MLRALWVLVELAGVTAIVGGVAMVSHPAALVVGGIAGLLASWRFNAETGGPE